MFRDALPTALKAHIFARDKGRCVYCGVRLTDYHIDHVFPHGQGGPDYAGNLVLACPPCNLRKGEDVDVTYITMALFHLMMVEEDLSWIGRFHLSQWIAFATPLALDIEGFGGAQIRSGIDESEDEPEHQPVQMNFKLIRPAPVYARQSPVQINQESRQKVQEIINAQRRRNKTRNHSR